jgi:hypothetical protein
MTRRQRSRVVTFAALVLLFGILAEQWYTHGWQGAARQFLILMLTLAVLAAAIWWENGGES